MNNNSGNEAPEWPDFLPAKIIVDNGRVFTSAMVNELLANLGLGLCVPDETDNPPSDCSDSINSNPK